MAGHVDWGLLQNLISCSLAHGWSANLISQKNLSMFVSVFLLEEKQTKPKTDSLCWWEFVMRNYPEPSISPDTGKVLLVVYTCLPKEKMKREKGCWVVFAFYLVVALLLIVYRNINITFLSHRCWLIDIFVLHHCHLLAVVCYLPIFTFDLLSWD